MWHSLWMSFYYNVINGDIMNQLLIISYFDNDYYIINNGDFNIFGISTILYDNNYIGYWSILLKCRDLSNVL